MYVCYVCVCVCAVHKYTHASGQFPICKRAAAPQLLGAFQKGARGGILPADATISKNVCNCGAEARSRIETPGIWKRIKTEREKRAVGGGYIEVVKVNISK